MKTNTKNAQVKKEDCLTLAELDELINELDVVEDDIMDRIIEPDPGTCPDCGGDLDLGDHSVCQRF